MIVDFPNPFSSTKSIVVFANMVRLKFEKTNTFEHVRFEEKSSIYRVMILNIHVFSHHISI
jgi:hypothetical protein